MKSHSSFFSLHTLFLLNLQTDEEAFRESFKNALMYLFTFGDTSANVDRVIKFVATFCTKLDDEEEFLLFIINIIFDVSVTVYIMRYNSGHRTCVR